MTLLHWFEGYLHTDKLLNSCGPHIFSGILQQTTHLEDLKDFITMSGGKGSEHPDSTGLILERLTDLTDSVKGLQAQVTELAGAVKVANENSASALNQIAKLTEKVLSPETDLETARNQNLLLQKEVNVLKERNI